MKKKMTGLVAALIMLMVGFLSTDALSFELITQTETVVVDDLEIDIIRMADNFIVMFDSSGSMAAPYKDTGKTKIAVEKAMLKARNARLPDLSFNAGLYSFTPKAGSFTLKALKPYYEMKPYNKAEFAAAIDQLPDKASGPTLLQGGLADLKGILAGLTGRTVVFIFTDGKFSESKKTRKAVDIARNLAKNHDVCFNVISSAPSQMEAQLLKSVASINACSRVIAFEDLVEKPGYISGSLFIIQEKIVPRAFDIQKVIGAELSAIEFDFNNIDIKSRHFQGLDALGQFLRDTPQAYVVLAGFTDSIGSQEYNLGLSRRRAESVGNYITERFGVAPERVVLQWYGEAAPVASNATEDGRSQNRRVEAIVAKLP